MKKRQRRIVLSALAVLFSLLSAVLGKSLIPPLHEEAAWLWWLCTVSFSVSPVLVILLTIELFRKEKP